MKKLSTFIAESAKAMIDVQDDTLNHIDEKQLKEYLDKCSKFLSKESQELINWLIVNNATYMHDLKSKEVTGNVLADFYNNGPYKDAQKKEIFKLIGLINKSGRLLEIPLFQTKDQFEGILSGKIAPDEVIIDLTSEAGRARVAKQYEPLCYKIANSWKGKSNIGYEDLLASAFEGLTLAMNSYGKKSNKLKKKEEELGIEIDTSAYKKTTFLTYASYVIRCVILEAVKNESHLVRVPTSQQSKERQEKGSNTKNRAVSGDKAIGGDEKGKTFFDLVGGVDNASRGLEDQDIMDTWKTLLKQLKDCGKFSEKMIRCWMQFNQLGGVEKKKNKDIADELGITPSNVTYYCSCINNYIKKDPKMKKIAMELISLYNESKQHWYEENDNDEPLHVSKVNEDNDNEV